MAPKKEIKVNQTDETVPSAEDAPVTDHLVGEDVPAIPDVENTTSLIEAALASDAVEDWNAVADRLYELEHSKAKNPGLHASRLGRLLERLP